MLGLGKKRVSHIYIDMIKDMYNGTITSMRIFRMESAVPYPHRIGLKVLFFALVLWTF